MIACRVTSLLLVNSVRAISSLKQTMNVVEGAKRAAARAAVDQHLKDHKTVGIGSGSTIIYAVERIGEIVKETGKRILCVPTSFQAKQLIRQNNLLMSDLEESPSLDIAFDGADEFDDDKVLIKGGGGCLTQEKIVASASKKLIIIVDYRKRSSRLGVAWKKGIPIEVIPLSFKVVSDKIQKTLGGQVILREAVSKAGPVVTDNGNFLLDWIFDTNKSYDWKEVETTLNVIPGVVENGLFVNMTDEIFIGEENGSFSQV